MKMDLPGDCTRTESDYWTTIRMGRILWFFSFVSMTSQIPTGGGQNASYSVLLESCDRKLCYQGSCYLTGGATRCVCNKYFTGRTCGVLDIQQTNLLVIANMLVAAWDARPAGFTQYFFLYYRSGTQNDVITQQIKVAARGSTALVGKVQGGVETYTVCIIDAEMAANIIRYHTSELMEHLGNCKDISTKPDYDSMFAWFLVIFCCMGAVLLVSWQRDKIELLYFYRPQYIYSTCNFEAAQPIVPEDATAANPNQPEPAAGIPNFFPIPGDADDAKYSTGKLLTIVDE